MQWDKGGNVYVRIFWGKLIPGTWDAYERHYLESVVPLSEQFKGFQGRQLLRNRTNPDEGLSISYWDTQEDMENYDKDQERQRVISGAYQYYAGEYWEKYFELRHSTIQP